MIVKLRVLWNVLRGRPTIYRVHFGGTVHIEGGQDRLLVAECVVTCDTESSGVSQQELRAAWTVRDGNR